MWLICSNRKFITKNDIFATVILHNNIFCHRLSDGLHCTSRPFTNVLRQWFLTGGTRTTWGYEEPKRGVRSTKIFRDTRPENLNQIFLNIHRNAL